MTPLLLHSRVRPPPLPTGSRGSAVDRLPVHVPDGTVLALDLNPGPSRWTTATLEPTLSSGETESEGVDVVPGHQSLIAP